MTTENTASPPRNALARIDRYISLTAMVLPDGLEFDQWAKQADGLDISRKMVKNKSMLFHVGDWLNYGESTFADIADKYSEAIKKTGYKQGTLYAAKHVAELIPPDRRREELSWSHHQAVASLPKSDQDYLLDLAVTDELTIPQLKQMVAAVKNGVAEAEAPEQTGNGAAEAVSAIREAEEREHAATLQEQLLRDLPAAQQLAEDYLHASMDFCTKFADGSWDAKDVAVFQVATKTLSDVTNRIFRNLAELT